MRGRLREQQTYAQPVNPGEVMTGETVGEVLASADPRFVPGDVVVGARGWQTHTATPGDRLTKLDRHGAPLSAYLGVLGMPGATAYRGITEICRPKKGETVVISAASGAVGSVAGQLAKRAGARVVGVAGGAEKCPMGAGQPGVRRLRRSSRARPAGCNWPCPARMASMRYFENVGGAVQAAVSTCSDPFARVAMCGMVSQYHEAEFRPPQSRLCRRQARDDPGLHRLRQAGEAGGWRALAAPWVAEAADLSLRMWWNGWRRPRRVGRHAGRTQLREIAGPGRARSDLRPGRKTYGPLWAATGCTSAVASTDGVTLIQMRRGLTPLAQLNLHQGRFRKLLRGREIVVSIKMQLVGCRGTAIQLFILLMAPAKPLPIRSHASFNRATRRFEG